MRADPLSLERLTRAELLSYFDEGWQLEDAIYRALDERAFHRVADSLRFPLIFYLGHTAAFYPHKLIATGLMDDPVDEILDARFAVGVDEDSFVDPIAARALERPWPKVSEVWSYRAQVRERVIKVIEQAPIEPVREDSPLWGLLMALEHQRIHIETTSVLIRQLPIELVQVPQGWQPASAGGPVSAHENTLVSIPGGRVRLGRDRPGDHFGWDAEHGDETVDVRPFRVSRHLVTNGNFAEFVSSGGYVRDDFWTREGRAWRTFRSARRPPFWTEDERLRTVFEIIDRPASWPAEVTFHEARAFCAWKGAGFRILTEAEHARLRQRVAPDAEANLGLRFHSPTAVTAGTPSGDAIYDLRGNVWEWVEDLARPLAGFKPDRLYPDFSTPGIEGGHRMMLGGSWISLGAYGAPSARTWFRDHFLQHVGFRLARSV